MRINFTNKLTLHTNKTIGVAYFLYFSPIAQQ